jgi:hypothetical protein
VKRFFLKTQRPEIFENRSYPGQRSSLVKDLTTATQPMNYTGDGLTEKGNSQLGRVQPTRPTPDSGGIG